MTESDYIERDKMDLTADQIKVLKVLTSDYQPLTEVSEKTGLDPNYVAFIMDQFNEICTIATRHMTLTGYGTHLKAAVFMESDWRLEP